MANMKYIVVSYMDREYSERTPVEVPVIFPPVLVHKDMADHVKHCIAMDKRHSREHKVVGAGFIDLADLQTWGKSESLNIASRPEDSDLIRHWLQLFQGVPL